MTIRKDQWPILILNLSYLVGFAAFYASRQNYEFLLYIGVIVVFFVLILFTNERVRYTNGILWGLTLWGLLHMCGGGIPVGDKVLYGQMLIPLSDTYPVFRFDQLVHIIGFGVATLLIYHLLKPLLRPDLKQWTALSIVVVMAGLGVGALNEVVEFLAVVLVPETGVGGYENTALDLVADLIGAVLALAYIRVCDAKAKR
ncbi:MAG TPA: DUF2238 domain-containing protein [Candidatus Hydrogenedentes bacterium]|nr:DUF2238 domain-containing protein [Candidatus Hydrogenedentota bacterium]HIJ72717.1 DUF2238 domain-containing protein [Candidatus Hydrogenedentota bacterium]